ncbi:MAG: response regulator [Endomicrobiaceae bacterium]|nr:response regulator [Endomicrobiaceae bacterium]
MVDNIINAKVLIVEDDEVERISLQSALETNFLKVSSVGSGAEAENLAKEENYDILVVDYGLPDINGISLIRSIKNILNDVVPIVITGSSSIEIAIESIKIGAYDYVVKPLDIESLLKTIVTMLDERDKLIDGRGNLQKMVADINNAEFLVDDSKVNMIVLPNNELLKTNKKQIFKFFEKLKNIKIFKRG